MHHVHASAQTISFSNMFSVFLYIFYALMHFQMPAKTKLVELVATGTGTALIQISYQYNVRDMEPTPSFEVHVQIYSKDFAARLIMDVCAEFTGDGKESNMALMEISLPSGYIVDEQSLDETKKVKGVSVSTN